MHGYSHRRLKRYSSLSRHRLCICTIGQVHLLVAYKDINMMLYTIGSLGLPHNAMHSPSIAVE